MLGEEKIFEILHKAIEYSNADMTEVAVTVGESSLTRFANSTIHQNVFERNASLAVRAIIGKRIGYAMTNKLDDVSIRSVVEKAVNFARHSAENPDFVSLPQPKPISGINTFDQQTASFGPEDRASAVARMILEAGKCNALAAGLLSNGYQEFAVANTLGVNAYNATTRARLSTVMTANSGHGFAEQISQRISDIDPIAAAIEAANSAAQGKNPEKIEPGEYDVVLLPYAVEEMVVLLAYLGFSALAVQEGRSFMCGKFGQRITGENITIWDDGLDPRGLPCPFDAEGVPKKRVDLIVEGIANAVVYDSYTAYKEGKESTGHSIGGPGTCGPFPSNLFMQAGDASIEEMIASTKKESSLPGFTTQTQSTQYSRFLPA